MHEHGLTPRIYVASLADYNAGRLYGVWIDLDQTGEVDKLPEYLRGYFDYESFARDLELGGDVFTIELGGRTHVFSNR